MYLQLSTLMRRRISVGEWPQDMRLPALEELMQEFGVARVTVRQALALLEAEGLVTRKQGRGTFVTGSPERAEERREGQGCASKVRSRGSPDHVTKNKREKN